MLRRSCLIFFLTLPLLAPAAVSPLREQVDPLLKAREWQRAQALLDRAVATQANDADAWALLGQVRMALGDHEGAVAALEQATTVDPRSSEYQRQLGDACGFAAGRAGMFSKLGFAKRCKAAYERAAELDPKSVVARWSLMEYYRQAPSLAGGGMDGAYAQAEAIQKIDPSAGRLARATLFVAEKKMVEAFGLFDEALAASPEDYGTLYQFGRLCAMTGQRLDQGLAALRKCLTLPPPTGQPGYSPVNWRIGNLLEKKGDKPGAKAAYEAAVALDPTFVRAAEDLRRLGNG